ncbi:SDR family NAD(P)-dependent oxidoreductase [Actinomadura viridis]|uniref:NAD(P)-dependent dehydrogenase (Short-subunit alcohol dehydrogenase family) n=1 Tax=Actinomadura viridis TaxID=58110 RepID=A0A931DQ01_9ACTN|nr:SDR family NAD(P)-dependent oxidoreductase [Actinomadura viridis]MBG6090608.1 NAD(P)-dependent dehydrogenase (short-subunit alcohol dehydrogenase family) [Actinomadura viridis]
MSVDPGTADIEACLRVLARARAADPADPRWRDVHEAAAQVYRAGKKSRKAARLADRRRNDREATAATARFQDQDPWSAPVPALPDTASGTTPRAPSGTGNEPVRRVLTGTRRCYVCKTRYQRVHLEYHMLCPACAEENLARRHARCDLRGRRAIVTGGRVKIGFQVALKLLRDGAEVTVTTRFPRDAARRFAEVPDARDWIDRLHVHGLDLLDLPAVAALLRSAHERFGHLDILINNAAQTIRRPAAYHREVGAAESAPLTGAAALVDVTDAHDRPQSLEGPDGGHGAALPALLPLAGTPGPEAEAMEALFPAGRTDETGQPLDLRDRNSWSLRLHEVDPGEWLEVQMVNAFAPFLLTSRLRGLMEASPWPDRYVVQVSAMEGSFSREGKTVRHPHTNMAKASLNMLTRTAAADYAASGIHMNSVDTGWITDERPHPAKLAQREAGFRPPLDVIDGAARVYDPVVRGVGGERLSGLFLKDYRPVEW